MSIPSILSGVLVAAAVGAAVGATTKVAHNAYTMGLFGKMKEYLPQRWNPSKQVSDRTKETEVKNEESVIVPEGVTSSLEPQSIPAASQSPEATPTEGTISSSTPQSASIQPQPLEHAQEKEVISSSTPQSASIQPQPLEHAQEKEVISSSAPQAPTTEEPSQEKAS